VTVIQVSKELSGMIAAKSFELKGMPQSVIDSSLKKDKDFQRVFLTTKSILNENQFVVIKNIGFNCEKAIFESFIKLFGELCGIVEYTDIKLDYLYMACRYDNIELHNDEAIDLYNQPEFGLIQVLHEDPLKTTQNGLVKVDDIISYLEIYNQDLFFDLLNHKVPMLAFGINYSCENKDEIITKEPILYKQDGEYKVRFDPNRISYFYWKKNITQPIKERKLISDFLIVAKKFRVEFYLEAGDILIYHNQKMLHDRTACNFALNSDGTLSTREIFVGFTHT